MTILQIKVVLLAAKLGSVSLAAKELGISQSNASNYIKDVEDELGVQLLNRSRKGITTTDKGTEFLEHAKRMIEENDSIMKISNNSSKYRLRVGSMNYTVAFNAFLKVCEEQNGNNNTDLQYHNVSLENGLEMLKSYRIDILVAMLRKDNLNSTDWFSQTSDLERIHLHNVQFCVRVRKNHPICYIDSFKNGTFKIDELTPYPYIDYVSFNRLSEMPAIDDKSYMYCSNKILVDGKENRYFVTGKTDGYSIGIKPDYETLEKYGLAYFPISGLIADMSIFIRNNEKEKEEIKHYIELIKQEKITLDADLL